MSIWIGHEELAIAAVDVAFDLSSPVRSAELEGDALSTMLRDIHIQAEY